MDGGYKILEVQPKRRATLAVLPAPCSDSDEMREALLHDVRRLLRQHPGPVVLDLRQVTFFGDCLFPPILELWKELHQRADRLVICGGERFREFVQVTGLHSLLEVVDRFETESV
jgi:anti-anti-sigma regulatory factor